MICVQQQLVPVLRVCSLSSPPIAARLVRSERRVDRLLTRAALRFVHGSVATVDACLRDYDTVAQWTFALIS